MKWRANQLEVTTDQDDILISQDINNVTVRIPKSQADQLIYWLTIASNTDHPPEPVEDYVPAD